MKIINRLFVLFLIGLVFLVFGCTVNKTVMIKSDPRGAEVKVTADQKGPVDFSIGDTPVRHNFTFGVNQSFGPSMYNLEVSKTGYEKKTVSLRKDDTIDTIDVTLNREVVKEVTRFELVISEEGYTIEPRTVRAWVEDIERDVMAASSFIRLGSNQSVLGMTLSPDGRTLAFSLAEKVKNIEGHEKTVANLRSVPTAGGGVTQITSGQWVDANPVYSNNEYILFNSNRMRKNRADIFRISAKRTSGIAVLRQTSEGFNYQPTCCENNMTVFTYKPVYQGSLSGTEQIWSIGGQNDYPTQLREGCMPSLSPDGQTIAFIGRDHQLWTMPAKGQNPMQLTYTKIPLNDQEELLGKKNPTWSPDGQYILYACADGKDSRDFSNYDIWIINKNGGTPRQLTTNGSVDDFPVVFPDQRYIYFVSNRGFREGIWRIPFPEML